MIGKSWGPGEMINTPFWGSFKEIIFIEARGFLGKLGENPPAFIKFLNIYEILTDRLGYSFLYIMDYKVLFVSFKMGLETVRLGFSIL